MISVAIFVLTAVLEIAGSFAYWAWARQSAPVWWLLPGTVALAGFARLLTLVDTSHAGRAYAAYGGIYVAASLAWLWWFEGIRPDRWDLLGGGVCIIGTPIILLAPRSTA